MEIITQLTAFATKLEEKGLLSLASDVDGATKTFFKVAKELGVQGYWVQNGRCWSGCYRSKRASQPRTSANDIWFQCQEEYEKAIAGNSDSWNKYAGTSVKLIKTAQTEKFAESVKALVSEGEEIGTAVFNTISKNMFDRQVTAIDAAESLIKVSESLSEIDLGLSTQAANLSSMMTKEAWGFGGVKNMIAPALNKMRGNYDPKNIGNLNVLRQHLSQLKNTLQGFLKQKTALESAIGNEQAKVSPELQQAFRKGLRPLSIQSLNMMDQAIMNEEKKAGQPSASTAPAANGKPAGGPAVEPSDASIPQRSAPAAVEEGQAIPLQQQEPTETHDVSQFVNDMNGGELPQSIKDEFARMMVNPRAYSKSASARKVYSLIKQAGPPPNLRQLLPSGKSTPKVAPKPANPPLNNQMVAPLPPAAPTAPEPAATQIGTVAPEQMNQPIPPAAPAAATSAPEIAKTPRPPRAAKPKPTVAPAAPASPTETPADVPQDFGESLQQFQSLPPDAQQTIMRKLMPMIQQHKSQIAQQGQQSLMSNEASSKRKVFKLA